MMATVTEKRTLMQPRNVARIGMLVAAGVAVWLVLAGCIGGWTDDNISEGNRCNPYDSHNECSSGLACTVSSWQVKMAGTVASNGLTVPALGVGAGPVLPFCPENYCCPVDSNGNLTTSGNANCQPGCNGGANTFCAASGDPATCAFVDGGQAAVNALDAGAPAETGTPAEASTPADGGGGG